jgi:hypothetical protein
VEVDNVGQGMMVEETSHYGSWETRSIP